MDDINLYESLEQRIGEALRKVEAALPNLRTERGEAIAKYIARSPQDRSVSSKGHLIHKLKAKDTTDRWAYYFILVQPTKEKAFLKSIEGDGKIDLEDFGKVVASCYGEEPSQEVRDYLNEKYGFLV